MQVNKFKFCLSQGDVVFYVNEFQAQQYMCATSKTYIDIRPLLMKFIQRYQKALSYKTYTTTIEDYDNKKYFESVNNFYSYGNECGIDEYEPKPVEKVIEHLKFYGVPFKIGFYLDDKIIVERDFFVNGFNKESRNSLEILYTSDSIIFEIKNFLKKVDMDIMYHEYETSI